MDTIEKTTPGLSVAVGVEVSVAVTEESVTLAVGVEVSVAVTEESVTLAVTETSETLGVRVTATVSVGEAVALGMSVIMTMEAVPEARADMIIELAWAGETVVVEVELALLFWLWLG
jgi:hypothetical protein